MNPNEAQFNEGHAKATRGIEDAIKLTRGLSEIFANKDMSSDEKDAAIKALNESVKGKSDSE